jgi:hypothetical protein
MSKIDRRKIPKHLRHLSDKVIALLMYLFRSRY